MRLHIPVEVAYSKSDSTRIRFVIHTTRIQKYMLLIPPNSGDFAYVKILLVHTYRCIFY